LSVNTPFHFKAGSVGRLLPGIRARIEPVEGVERGGRLVVKGPNVMLGYILPDQPGVIQPPADGWHDTGDIVELDEDGFIWIKGRFKRFAKVGAEMISLAAVEEVAAALWPGQPQAVIAVEDEHKGERLALVSAERDPDLPRLWKALKEAGLPELAYPKQAIFMAEIPVTPLGKINMPKLEEAARQILAPAEPEPAGE
jgi:acyl-[acyl-carrier-protein]-phospholipid O-acyltransferase/long-chain-fatty-acid--[acyl-carrier-protein] ligase